MGVELEASASIGLAIGDKLDAISDLLGKKEPRPTFIPLSGAMSVAATSGFVVLGKPPANKIWNVLSLVTYGADDHTAVAGGNAAIYVTSDPSTLSLFGLRDTGIAIPSGKTYSKDIAWCYPSEFLVVSFVATGATAMGANVTVAEWDIRDKW